MGLPLNLFYLLGASSAFPTLLLHSQNLLLYPSLLYRWKVDNWVKCSKFHLLRTNSSTPHSYYFFSRFFSVSLPHYCAFIKIWNICETEYEFRFRKMWNGFCNPFHKIFNFFFVKRITESVSHFFWNGIRIPFHEKFEIFVERNTNSVS